MIPWLCQSCADFFEGLQKRLAGQGDQAVQTVNTYFHISEFTHNCSLHLITLSEFAPEHVTIWNVTFPIKPVVVKRTRAR
jgi:hypothetical protein